MSIFVCQLWCNAVKFCFSVNLNLFQIESRAKHKIFMNVQPRTGTFNSCREEFFFFLFTLELLPRWSDVGGIGTMGVNTLAGWLFISCGYQMVRQVSYKATSHWELCRTLHNNTAVLLGTLKSSSWLGEDSDLAWLSVISFIRGGLNNAPRDRCHEFSKQLIVIKG